MPRRPRVVLPHIPLHLIQRGNNRQVCFVADEDYWFYLDCLTGLAGRMGCRVHAYVLMTNHVHLLISAGCGEPPGPLMKALGQRYVQYFNRTYRRSGTLWEGRYRACLIQAEDYLLACQRYIEPKPVGDARQARPATQVAGAGFGRAVLRRAVSCFAANLSAGTGKKKGRPVSVCPFFDDVISWP